MKEIVKMLVVLSGIAAVCGFLLAAVKIGTQERVEEQILLNVKGPAVNSVLETSTNDLIKDRAKIKVGEDEKVIFVGKREGAPWAFSYECYGNGFGDKIGVMVGFDFKTDKLTGVAVTVHKETPGIGSKAAEPTFTKRFIGVATSSNFHVKADGGTIDGISGATVSAKGICEAVSKCAEQYLEVKEKVFR